MVRAVPEARSSNTQDGTEPNPIANTFTPVEARYVKITVTGASGYSGSYVSIYEIKVMNVCTTPPVNAPPTVSITSPTNGASFVQGANINVTANANNSDSDGPISKVEFFNGSTSLGVDSKCPYAVALANAAKGTYNL